MPLNLEHLEMYRGVSGVYALVNPFPQPNEPDGYVGSAYCLYSRLRRHYRLQGDGLGAKDAIKAGCTEWVILEVVDTSGLSKTDARPLLECIEQEWIRRAGYEKALVFNKTDNARLSVLGLVQSPSSRAKNSATQKRLAATRTVEERRRGTSKARSCLTPESMAANGRKVVQALNARLSYEERAANGRKGCAVRVAKYTPAQQRTWARNAAIASHVHKDKNGLSVNARKAGTAANALRDADGKSVNARKRGFASAAKLTPEQLAERMRHCRASLTPEKNRAKGAKGSHVFWHLKRNIVNPNCAFCVTKVAA